MSADPVFLLTTRWSLASLLLGAGLHKSLHQERTRAAITAYFRVPHPLQQWTTWLVVTVEMTIGAALITPSTSRLASAGAAILFAAYFGIMALNMARGHRRVDCGCSFQRSEAPLSGAHLARNALLVTLAIAASVLHSGRTVGWIDGLQIAAAVACAALLYLSADALLAKPGHVVTQEM
jgi:uncharacterized membrane protein YphA (DoxX/SURF4 family)